MNDHEVGPLCREFALPRYNNSDWPFICSLWRWGRFLCLRTFQVLLAYFLWVGHSPLPLQGSVSSAPTFGRLLNPSQRGNKLLWLLGWLSVVHKGLQYQRILQVKKQGLWPAGTRTQGIDGQRLPGDQGSSFLPALFCAHHWHTFPQFM